MAKFYRLTGSDFNGYLTCLKENGFIDDFSLTTDDSSTTGTVTIAGVEQTLSISSAALKIGEMYIMVTAQAATEVQVFVSGNSLIQAFITSNYGSSCLILHHNDYGLYSTSCAYAPSSATTIPASMYYCTETGVYSRVSTYYRYTSVSSSQSVTDYFLNLQRIAYTTLNILGQEFVVFDSCYINSTNLPITSTPRVVTTDTAKYLIFGWLVLDWE